MIVGGAVTPEVVRQVARCRRRLAPGGRRRQRRIAGQPSAIDATHWVYIAVITSVSDANVAQANRLADGGIEAKRAKLARQ
jgi:hypothetical protein